jgi:hypothetical protein
MQENQKKNRFIPFRKTDIIEMCISDSRLADQEKDEFREFSQILEALFHFEFHQRLETLKNCYTPFNPDADTRLLADISADEKKRSQKLDDRIEKWFAQKWNCHLDFEIDDAMQKLQRLELVSRKGDVLEVKPLSEAKQQLDYTWDNYFQFNPK